MTVLFFSSNLDILFHGNLESRSITNGLDKTLAIACIKKGEGHMNIKTSIFLCSHNETYIIFFNNNELLPVNVFLLFVMSVVFGFMSKSVIVLSMIRRKYNGIH